MRLAANVNCKLAPMMVLTSIAAQQQAMTLHLNLVWDEEKKRMAKTHREQTKELAACHILAYAPPSFGKTPINNFTNVFPRIYCTGILNKIRSIKGVARFDNPDIPNETIPVRHLHGLYPDGHMDPSSECKPNQ